VALLARTLVVLAAVGLALVTYRAALHLVDRVLRPLEGASDYPAKVQRARTLAPLMTNVIRYTIAFVAVVVVLREVEVDVQALLVSAGVLGLAVGLGAQSLESPEVPGVVRLGESDLGLRLTAKVDAAHRVAAEAELRRRILEAFEREGITFPQRVVYVERTSP
jgi:moderate conductance mechanosensitive channel